MKIKLYYYFNPSPIHDEEFVEVSMHERSKQYWPNLVFLERKEVEVPDVDVPSMQELTEKIIDNLKEQKKEIMADTHLKIKVIDEKINELLCIENKV
jgi:hypothetical protein